MTYFPPLAVYRNSIFEQEKAALDTMSNLIKSREYNVQNVTVSLKCSYYVFSNIMIKPISPKPQCFRDTGWH